MASPLIPYKKIVCGINKIINNVTMPLNIVKLVKDCNAMIAGGSMLSFITGKEYYFSDIDVFVNEKNADYFINIIKKCGWKDKCEDKYHLGINDNRKYVVEHVLKRNTFMMKKDGIEIDVITIPDNISHQEIINGFDLTCSQIWYNSNDNEEVYYMDEDIFNEIGHITPKYKDVFPNMRKIFYRVEKYMRKGFTIKHNENEVIVNNDGEVIYKEDKQFKKKEELFIDENDKMWIKKEGNYVEVIEKDFARFKIHEDYILCDSDLEY